MIQKLQRLPLEFTEIEIDGPPIDVQVNRMADEKEPAKAYRAVSVTEPVYMAFGPSAPLAVACLAEKLGGAAGEDRLRRLGNERRVYSGTYRDNEPGVVLSWTNNPIVRLKCVNREAE